MSKIRIDSIEVENYRSFGIRQVFNFPEEEYNVRRQIKAPTNCIPKSNYNYKPNNYLAINCI